MATAVRHALWRDRALSCLLTTLSEAATVPTVGLLLQRRIAISSRKADQRCSLGGNGVVFALSLGILVWAASLAFAADTRRPILTEQQLAQDAFGADAPWYLANIPFLEIDDAEIQRAYYYRWKLYRSHLRQIGTQGVDETEYLTNVPWARQPYTDLNDSSSFHILEGRWLRNPEFVHAMVDHLYTGGGNDRHFSESVAAATFAWTQVTGDARPALDHLDTMQQTYNLWDDHFDARRNLYWIEPIHDATEYTIASIDASGAGFTETPSRDQDHNGFTGGFAFRPTINAYQFANAEAIAHLAALAGKPEVSREYQNRANALRSAVLSQLWDPALTHFTDVYQRSADYAREGTRIRGRELAGFVPWVYNLVPATAPGQPQYSSAWKHALSPSELAGDYGLRTVEPSYPRYLRQYRYDQPTGLAECQWNGPAWPFQISQALTGIANLLQDPQEHAVVRDDYIRLLRQYTRLHRSEGGKLDVEEDYNPDTGRPIVGMARSHHYNHSTYNDLILSGLLGIRPRSDDVLELNPLLPVTGSSERPIRYFALEHLAYHGRDLTLLYDEDGTRYHRGMGLSVLASGQRIYGPAALKHVIIALEGAPRVQVGPRQDLPIDLAANVWERAPSEAEPDLPIASASSTDPTSSPYQAIDGRLWFFPEISNGWSPALNSGPPGLAARVSWFAVDLRHPRKIDRLELAFFSDSNIRPPTSIQIEFYQDGQWLAAPQQQLLEKTPVANGTTHLLFSPTTLQQFRLVFSSDPDHQLRLIEVEAFGAH